MHWLTFLIYCLVQRVINFLFEGVAAVPVQYRYHTASVAETAFPGVIVYHCHHTGAVLDYGVSIMAQHPIVQFRAPNPTLFKLWHSTICSQKFPSLEKRAKDTAKIQPRSLSPTTRPVKLFKFLPVGMIPWRKV